MVVHKISIRYVVSNDLKCAQIKLSGIGAVIKAFMAGYVVTAAFLASGHQLENVFHEADH